MDDVNMELFDPADGQREAGVGQDPATILPEADPEAGPEADPNPEAGPEADPNPEADPGPTFDDRVEQVLACVFSHPSFRELKYRVLLRCEQMVSEADLEAIVQASPLFPEGRQTPLFVIVSLVEAGGLERQVLLQDGSLIDPEAADAMDEGERDRQFVAFVERTTAEGMEATRRMAPDKRMDDLLCSRPLQRPGYLDVLQYLAESPRTRYDVERFCAGKPYLKAPPGSLLSEVRPSHFLDKLERAGVIEWRDGWMINDSGRAFLSSVNN